MGVSKAVRSWWFYVLIGNQIPAVLICKCSGDPPSGNLLAIVPGSCHMYLKMVCNILEASKIFLSLFRYLGCNFLILNCLAVTPNGLAVWGDNCFMKIFLADDSFFYFTYSSCNWCQGPCPFVFLDLHWTSWCLIRRFWTRSAFEWWSQNGEKDAHDVWPHFADDL